jgi:glycosyltransferase involved in cell wall biosynthesis
MSKELSSNLKIVSLVLPIYNGEKFLRESLNSILNQTFRNFELIIVDDGSTDKSMDILNGCKDNRIRLIINKENKGSVYSYNLAIKKAEGKYIAICTQDDIFHPKRIEKEFGYLEKNKNIFLVGSSAIYIDEKGREIKKFRKYENSKLLGWRLRKSNSIIFPSIMFRNKKVIFDKFCEYNLYYKLLKRGEKLINLPDFLVKYRVHPNAESIFDKEIQKQLYCKVIKKFKNLKDDTPIIEKIIFIIKLAFHYLRTFNEKKTLNLR